MQPRPLAKFIGIGSDWGDFTDNDIFTRHTHTGLDDAIVIKFVIGAMLHPNDLRTCRFLEFLNDVHTDFLLRVLVRTVEKASEQSAINAALIHDD